MKKILFLFSFLISVAAYSQNNWMPATGEIAKDFTLKTVNNEPVNLKELLKKQPVILLVLRGWPGYQCPICTKQVGGFVASSDEFAKRKVSVLMVYPGPSQELINHANEFKEDFSFPTDFYFTIDPDYSMVNLYGLRWEADRETAYPSTFIIRQDGKIVYSKISHTHGGRSTVEELLEFLDKQ